MNVPAEFDNIYQLEMMKQKDFIKNNDRLAKDIERFGNNQVRIMN